ncbi:MAG: hypothetical protein NC417_05130 [Candidatus Gastranaerophilales bacterium]|nr:hypothetical protein [Candidatus Gastranaerophilales bacterium]
MDNESKDEVQGYQYIVTKFGEEKVRSRAEFLYNTLSDYIKMQELTDKVEISRSVLKHVLIDYFVDIDRLKDFSDISKVNDSKIYAYLSYWLLRHKPLHMSAGCDEQELVFVNEEFVSHFLRGYLFSQPDGIPIMNDKKEDVDVFVKTLQYFFKYRDYSAKNIEIMILAFVAGRGYQYSVDCQN